MKFLVDMPVTPLAVAHLEARGHGAAHASAVGLATASDQEILATARREGRIVVTADLDYPRLLAEGHSQAPGLVLFRGGTYSDREMLALLDRVIDQMETLDLEHSIIVVDEHRIRRRALPIEE